MYNQRSVLHPSFYTDEFNCSVNERKSNSCKLHTPYSILHTTRHSSLLFWISGVLWTGGFSTWMLYLTQRKIDPYIWTDCKVAYFLYYFCSHYSSSLLMIMALDKCCALYFPFKSKIISTLQNTKRISAAAAFVFLAFDAQCFFLYDAKTSSNGQKSCVQIGVPKDYWSIYYVVDSFLYSFIPLSVMFTANCFIVLKFMTAKLNNRNGGTESVNQALSKSAVKGSVMLLTVSFAFIFLTTPICIDISVGGLPRIFSTVAAILHYLNHSINGVLYCISGSRFRQELWNLFSCCRTKRNMTGSGMNTVTSQVSFITSPIPLNINEI